MFIDFAFVFLVVYSAGVGAAPAVAPKTISGPTDCTSAGDFTLCQNLWGRFSGAGTQSTTLNSAWTNGVSWETTYDWSNGPSSVKSYANVEHITAKGIQLQNVKSAPSSWNWRYVSQSPGIRADVAYDIWTGVPSSGSPASSASSYEIMIWLSGKGGVQPVGSRIQNVVSIGGHSWALWRGPNSNWQVLSFVSLEGDINNFNVDLNEFFQYLIAYQGVPKTQFIQSIQAGTEPFTGQAKLVTDSYSVYVDHF